MNQLFPYAATTGDLTVRVSPSYLADQSDPERPLFVWAYHIRIENGGSMPVQLISRRWLIIDSRGRTQTVEGLGVVGEQPVIAPGEAYDYVSGCPLTTPSGTMEGAYQMQVSDGDIFEILIPPFSLDSPHARTRLN